MAAVYFKSGRSEEREVGLKVKYIDEFDGLLRNITESKDGSAHKGS